MRLSSRLRVWTAAARGPLDAARHWSIRRSVRSAPRRKSEHYNPYDPAPAFRTYTTGGSVLSVCGPVMDVKAILASYYSNLALTPRSMFLLRPGAMATHFAPEMAPQTFAEMGYFEHEACTAFLTRPVGELREWILSGLEDGWYFRAHVNEYYLSYSGFYRLTDFGHAAIITGYGATDESARLCSYARGRYEIADVPLVSLLMALKYRGPRCFEPISEQWSLRIDRFRVKPVSGEIYSSQDARVLLQAYLSSTVDGGHARPWEGSRIPEKIWRELQKLPDRGFVYGLAASQACVDYLRETVGRGQPLNMRISRTLLEHKQIMVSNLRYWLARVGLPAHHGQWIAEYASVVAWAHNVHLACMNYSSRANRDRQAVLKPLGEAESMLTREQQVLTQVRDTVLSPSATG